MIIRLLLIVGLILSVAAFLAYECRGGFSPYVYDPAGASTRGDVTHYTSVPPPPEARDIRVAAYSEGQATANFVRFSAPADNCRKYAVQVAHKQLESLDPGEMYFDLGMFRFDSHVFKDLRWFDLPYAQKFWSVQNGALVFQEVIPIDDLHCPPDFIGADVPSDVLHVAVRVDASRGVFYYYGVH